VKRNLLAIALSLPLLLSAAAHAATVDAKLLSLVPPGAQVVAGMSVHPDRTSSFILITHNNGVDLDDFYALSGADSSHVIQQVIFVAALDVTGRPAEHSLLVSGHFDPARIFRAAMDNGASATNYAGIRVLVVQPFARERRDFHDVRWLAALDSNVILFGSIISVQQELDRHLAGSRADPSLLGKLARMRHDDQTWCVLSAPAWNTEMRDALAVVHPQLAERLKDGDSFQFGIRYGRQVEFEYEITTGSASATHAISTSLTRSLTGLAIGSPLLPSPDLTADDSTVRGVIKVSTTRYNVWLAEVSARGRVRNTLSQ
jgi:hypothetical protein